MIKIDIQKALMMKNLGLTEKEADELIAFDKTVDKMKTSEVSNDLSQEQKEIVKKFSNTGTRKTPTVYKFDTAKRERKTNTTKAALIAEIATFLTEKSESEVKNCEILNKERMISFTIGDNTYELTLIQKRKPK